MESIEATLHSSELSPETLSAFFDALKPGGRLGVFVKGGGEQDSSSAIQKEVSKRLTLEGFEDVVVSEQTSVSGTRATKVSGRKPKWERGVTFSLGEKKTKKTLVSKASAWEEDDDDRDEMIDEDALLTEKDKAKPTAEGEGVGCPPTRKPCKDCTCGRKEEEEMKENATPASSVVKMDLENDPNDETFKSACGNCALGDAFRCAGCPYLGQPAFKENDEENKVVMLDDLGTLPCCLRIASATTLTPIKTKGTPFPGLVLAPTKCNPETLGVSKLLIPVLVGGLNAANCNSPCDKPNTAPFLMLYMSLHSAGVRTSSFSIISDSSPCPASRKRRNNASRAASTISFSVGTGTPLFLQMSICSWMFATGNSIINAAQPSGAHDLSVYTGLQQ
ncbi:unnamed protein product [Bathycoccus prasinos]